MPSFSSHSANALSMVLYHGTAVKFECFDSSRVGSMHVDVIRDLGSGELEDPTAFYFTNDPNTAIWYAKDSARRLGKPEDEGFVMSVSLAMSNPKLVDFQEQGIEFLAEEIEVARKGGFDGLICKDYDDGGVSDHYVVFEAGQIQVLKVEICHEFEAREGNEETGMCLMPMERDAT